VNAALNAVLIVVHVRSVPAVRGPNDRPVRNGRKVRNALHQKELALPETPPHASVAVSVAAVAVGVAVVAARVAVRRKANSSFGVR
jgi:hypothetical protein